MTSVNATGNRWTRDYIFDILRDLEIRFIFGSPGTNEIPIIDGCDIQENRVTYIECLHENIAMGAAMGYARMTGKPGVVVIHITPGTGHSLGNLFNAWKSHVPLVVLCGQQHNELVTQEPILASDVVQIASQFTKWAHEVRSWQEMQLVLQRAFKEAFAPPTGPVFIALPWDFTIHEVDPNFDEVLKVTRIPPRFSADPEAVRAGAAALAQAKSPVIVVGDAVGYAQAWPEIQELAELMGAPVYLETQSSLASFPNSDYHWQGELPGSQGGMQAHLRLHDVAFLCGFRAQAQVNVFKFSDGPLIPATVKQIYLSNNTWDIAKNDFGEVGILGDVKATLAVLNGLVRRQPPAGAAERNQKLRAFNDERNSLWQQYLNGVRNLTPIRAAVVAEALGQIIRARGLERKFVYVHEAASDAPPFQLLLPFAEPISYYNVEGGSLGASMPGTLGIKLAEQGWQGIEAQLVVNVVGDGTTLYYPQVWWTGAQHKLPILHVITNNLEYRTLIEGLASLIAAYGSEPGFNWNPVTTDPTYLKIQGPNIDFVGLAKSFGVDHGQRVSNPQDVRAALEAGVDHVLNNKSPYVLDVLTDPEPTPDGPQIPPPVTRALTGTPSQVGQTSLARVAQPPLDIFYQRQKGN